MLLKLQKYELEVTYKRGQDMYIVDADTVQSPFDDDPEEEIHYEVLSINPISPSKYTQLVEATGSDVILSQLAHVVNNGNWPERFQGCPEWMKPFFAFRDELSVDNGIVLRGTKLIVPEVLRDEYMQQLHKNHMSDSTSKLARDYFYWPKMSDDIYHYVDKCEPCNSTKPRNQKEPMILLAVPDRPWQILSTVVFE